MAGLTDAQIGAAADRGQLAHNSEPRAISARCDGQLGRIIVELANGCTFAFPPRLAQGLEVATEEELAPIEILGAGYGLHWEAVRLVRHQGLYGPACWTDHVAGESRRRTFQRRKRRAPP